MFKSKKRILIILTVVVIAGGYWFYGNGQNQEGQIDYRTENPQIMDLERTVSSLGKILPKESVEVGAQVSGQLEKLHAEVGDLVEEGSLLAEIDPEILQARVDAGQAQLKELRASHQQQLAQIKLSKARAERNRKLYKDDAVSESDVEATDAELEIAEARLLQLDAQIERNQSNLEADITNLNYTRIYAPMSGTVIEEVAEEGRTLNANQTTPTILRIADLDLMEIEADVSESDVSLLQPDMPVRFTTLGLPDREWNTTVRQVLPQPEVLNDVVLYKALMEIQNSDGALMSEMTAQVFFIVGSAKSALTIPAGALQEMNSVRPDFNNSELVNNRFSQGSGMGDGGGMGGGGRGEISPEQIQARMANLGGNRDMSPEQMTEIRARMEAMGGGEGMGWTRDANANQNRPQENRPQAVMSDDIRRMRRQNPDATMATVRVLNDDGKPEIKTVLVGLKTRTHAQILAGLSSNDDVIIGEINPNSAVNATDPRMQNMMRFGGFGM